MEIIFPIIYNINLNIEKEYKNFHMSIVQHSTNYGCNNNFAQRKPFFPSTTDETSRSTPRETFITAMKDRSGLLCAVLHSYATLNRLCSTLLRAPPIHSGARSLEEACIVKISQSEIKH